MKWRVTVEIDDPRDLIDSYVLAKKVVRDSLIPENYDVEVTDAELILEHPELFGTQREVLYTLKEHGFWLLGCEWSWTTSDYTQKVLDTLVRLRLVKLEDGIYTPV